MENSHIEPSERYGTLMLDTLRTLIGAPEREIAPFATCYAVVGDGATVVDRPQGTRSLGVLLPEVRYALLGEDYGYYAIEWQGGVGWVSYADIAFVPCEA